MAPFLVGDKIMCIRDNNALQNRFAAEVIASKYRGRYYEDMSDTAKETACLLAMWDFLTCWKCQSLSPPARRCCRTCANASHDRVKPGRHAYSMSKARARFT